MKINLVFITFKKILAKETERFRSAYEDNRGDDIFLESLKDNDLIHSIQMLSFDKKKQRVVINSNSFPELINDYGIFKEIGYKAGEGTTSWINGVSKARDRDLFRLFDENHTVMIEDR